eukprot:2085260-Karenia_brevis.AAC.1
MHCTEKVEYKAMNGSIGWTYSLVQLILQRAKGCKPMQGIAPPGGLERQIQKFIDENNPDKE